jgi:divalent metal cation (Fe/Co/Zn/Cd) transporter
MIEKQADPPKRAEENTAYSLLIFFICMLLVKSVFGVILGSKSLLDSSMFALFGALMSITCLVRIHAPCVTSADGARFSHGKLDSFLTAGISVIAVIATVTTLYSIVHLTFFHTIYPPDLAAGWLAAAAGAVNWCFAYMMRNRVSRLDQLDASRIRFFLNADLLMSLLVIIAVVISRCGLAAMDYILAIPMAIFVIFYSAHLLYDSLKGLMDASCDAKTRANVSFCLNMARENLDIAELRVTRMGRMIEIVAIIGLSKDTRVEEARRLAGEITQALRECLGMPHEIHIGFRSIDDRRD